MASIDIDTVYREIAAAVDGAELTGYNLKIAANDFYSEAPPVPCFELVDAQGQYDQTFVRTDGQGNVIPGQMRIEITAQLLLSRAGGDDNGQRLARKLAGTGTNTIYRALWAARGAPGEMALNGAAADLHVTGFRGPRLVDYGEAHYYAMEFTILVIGD